jgi:hypothetical protein
MNKRTVISLLVCVNLILLTAIVLLSYSPPKALAQGVSLASNYLLVAGEIQNEFDALYILDVRTRVLHAFYFDRTNKKLVFGGLRYLERDFRNNKG